MHAAYDTPSCTSSKYLSPPGYRTDSDTSVIQLMDGIGAIPPVSTTPSAMPDNYQENVVEPITGTDTDHLHIPTLDIFHKQSTQTLSALEKV